MSGHQMFSIEGYVMDQPHWFRRWQLFSNPVWCLEKRHQTLQFFFSFGLCNLNVKIFQKKDKCFEIQSADVIWRATSVSIADRLTIKIAKQRLKADYLCCGV